MKRVLLAPFLVVFLFVSLACEEEDEGAVPVASEPTLSPTVEAVVAEIFWIAVDVAGIDRNVGFDDAKFLLEQALFADYDRRLTEIEGLGVDPFVHWPYCINAISGSVAIASLGLSESPVEAAPHANTAIEVILSLDNDVSAAQDIGSETGWSPSESKLKCEEFEDELREKYGWVTLTENGKIEGTPTVQDSDSGLDSGVFEVLATAGLWTFALDLAWALEDLISPEGDTTQRAALWFAFNLSLQCSMAEEGVPVLWSHVSDECEASEGIRGVVDSEGYERALRLATAVQVAAGDHLGRIAGFDEPTFELLTAASLTTHAGALVWELDDLVSPEGDSTPFGAVGALFELSVNCYTARERFPTLWSHVSDECEASEGIWDLVDSERYGQALGPATATRDAAAGYLLRICGVEE